MKFKFSITLFILFLSLLGSSQQAPELSQYTLHLPFVNNASIAKTGVANGAIVFKQQWLGLADAPRSLFMNYNKPLKIKDVFGGVLVTQDNIGVHSNSRMSFIYAQKYRIDREAFFSFSLAPGLEFIHNDYSRIETEYSDDPIFTGTSNSLLSINAGVAGYYYNKKFYGGVSMPTLLDNGFESNSTGNSKGKIRFNYRKIPINLIGGWSTDLGKYLSFNPTLLVKYEVASALQIDLNTLFEYKDQIAIGLSYRSLKSMVFLANYQLNKTLKLGYAFNMQIGSKLNPSNAGTHEVALFYGLENGRQVSVNLPKKIKKHKKRKRNKRKKALRKRKRKIRKRKRR